MRREMGLISEDEKKMGFNPRTERISHLGKERQVSARQGTGLRARRAEGEARAPRCPRESGLRPIPRAPSCPRRRAESGGRDVNADERADTRTSAEETEKSRHRVALSAPAPRPPFLVPFSNRRNQGFLETWLS